LYARTNNGSAAVDTALAGAWFGTPHRFRIDWTPTSVTYSIDGSRRL
jgi:Glycosyl hydrolases family 16